MGFPEHLLVVRSTVAPAHDAEFNRWYDEEHLPDAARLSARRGGALPRARRGGSHQYSANSAFASEVELRAAQASDCFPELVLRYDQAIGALSGRVRTAAARAYEQGW